MGKAVVNNAQLSCSMGTTPSNLGVVMPTVKAGGQPAANVKDALPAFNIRPFGMCQSQSNPQVAAATAAAQGVLTPQPCTPMTLGASWSPGSSKVKIRKQPAVDDSCTLSCKWGGSISVSNGGQTTVDLK